MRISGVIHVPRPSGCRKLPLAVSPIHAPGSPFGRSHAVSIPFADPEASQSLFQQPYAFTLGRFTAHSVAPVMTAPAEVRRKRRTEHPIYCVRR